MYTKIDYTSLVPEYSDIYITGLSRDIANLIADRVEDERTSYDIWTRLDLRFTFNTLENVPQGQLPVKCNVLVSMVEAIPGSFFADSLTGVKVFATVFITDKPYGQELEIEVFEQGAVCEKAEIHKLAAMDIASTIVKFMHYCGSWDC